MAEKEYIERDAFLAEQRHLYCENCARRKNGKGKIVYDIGDAPCRACGYGDVLDDVENAPAADVGWIPVTERLPDARERVLCYCRANIYEVMKMRTNGDWVYDTHHVYMHSFVTHWMPLPEPPKEE